MTMKRREAIRYLFITGSTVWLLPGCVSKSENTGQLLNASELELLTDIAETIIPSTNSPGTKELGIQYFISKIVSDCRPPDYQKKFIAGLNTFEDHIKKSTGEKWSALNNERRQKALSGILLAEKGNENVRNCIKEIRELAIKGYKNSKYYLTKVQEYKIVPGHFYGCVKVQKEAV